MVILVRRPRTWFGLGMMTLLAVAGLLLTRPTIAHASEGSISEVYVTKTFCVTATNCVAIGSYRDLIGYHPLIENYDGTNWTIVPDTDPGGIYTEIDLTDVDCASVTSCVVVGYYYDDNFEVHSLIETYDGTNWTIVPDTDPSGSITSVNLNSVSCASATSCVAVGNFRDNTGSHSLIETFDGTNWTIVPNTDPSGSILSINFFSVSCASATSCVAVGVYQLNTGIHALVETYDGSSWTVAPQSEPAGASYSGFSSVTCSSATSCVAVGSYQISTVNHSLIETFDGTNWTIVPNTDPSGSFTNVGLISVSCASATSCVALGFYQISTTYHSFIEIYDGSSWSVSPIAVPEGSDSFVISSVTCASATSCVAVGSYQISTVNHSLIETFDGTNWTIVSNTDPSGPIQRAELSSVSCTTPVNCVAGGEYTNADSIDHSLVETYDGSNWTIVSNINQPSDLEGLNITSTSIDLSWLDSATGFPTRNYSIQYKLTSDSTWDDYDAGLENPVTLSGLLPNTSYDFRIIIHDENDLQSSPSDSVTLTTDFTGSYLITDCQELQAMNDNLFGGNYVLANNIDCSDTVNWNDGAGFEPIGSPDDPFQGTFNGNKHTITGLYIDQLNGDGTLATGLFDTLQSSTISNLVIADSTISGTDASVGTLSGSVFDSAIANVQIVNGTLVAQNVYDGAVGGLLGYVEGSSIIQSSYKGYISSEAVSTGGLVGGLMTEAKTSSLADSFSQATIDSTSLYDSQTGGLVGISDASISKSYAGGQLNLLTEQTGDAVGGLIGSNQNSDTAGVDHSFSSITVTRASTPLATLGGLVGVDNAHDTVLDTSDYFDVSQLGTNQCTGDGINVCTAIVAQPNYFINNHTSPPLDSWNFNTVWNVINNGLPDLIPGRFIIATLPRSNPTFVPPTPVVPIHVPISTTTPDTTAPAETAVTSSPSSRPRSGSSAPVKIEEKGIAGTIKRFLRSIPANVLVSFPYVAMGALGLGALFLLVETIRQVKRLKEINLLIAKQTQIADERDTFWHLAANYLRAPITLLMGGIELLNTPATAKSLGAAVAKGAAITSKKFSHQSAEAITRLVTSMQVKVADIMEQIEKSSSLQGITRPKLNKGQKVSRQLRFWVPLLSVGALILLTNYVARGYRHLNVSTVSLITQLVIFVIVAMALYWILGALGLVTGKRKQAETLLAKQTAALDSARITLISKTAEALDHDVIKLDKLLDELPKNELALPIMREGSTRLLHMVDSFHLLISAQNNQLEVISPVSASSKLDSIIKASINSFRTQIESKRLTIDHSSFGSLKVPGSTAILDQVISSILANAIEFSPSGGVIKISESNHDGEFIVSIIDQGPGVNKDQLGHVFQPFTKADGQKALQMDHGGLGINLYLDQQIMQYLGGDIAIDTTEGQGTTLTLTWPEDQPESSAKLDLKSADTASPFLT